jgi:hypothetical protein
MKFALKITIAAVALFAATPAFADATLGTCLATDPNPDALFCSAVTGNANNGSPAGTAAALNSLIDSLDAQTSLDLGDANWSIVGGTKTFFSIGGTGADAGQILTFDEMLFGLQIISIHFGNAGTGSGGGGETIAYLFDFGASGAGFVDLNQQGFSNGVLITPPGGTPPVPEPATWLMFLVGFGVVGYSVRRRKPMLAQIA